MPILNRNTRILSTVQAEPVAKALAALRRDLDKTCLAADAPGAAIRLCRIDCPPESYTITADADELVIRAGDPLGFIYAVYHISRTVLGVAPFWFWNDQTFYQQKEYPLPAGYHAESAPARVRFRGWFINDEVLLSHWDAGQAPAYPWEMAFEALLRCGGNIIIPGTDRNAHRYRALAGQMGLWITHHHAEPLGAEMFLRAYPDLNPSFREHPDLFRKLWREGIEAQKDQNVVWNLGFRGQGDAPFWQSDPTYDTAEKRGALISALMREQYDLVKEYVPNPICCTNLYGEIMELYRQGYLSLPQGVIAIWADNGYGKMVSRRQGNHNPRVPALPDAAHENDANGTYYHVSFYDLQAANVLTMLPNPMELVQDELENAYAHGVRELWIVNCSNIKPHLFPLDYVARLWRKSTPAAAQRTDYLRTCYAPALASAPDADDLLRNMEQAYRDYFNATVPYDPHEDDHAGEQFYNYPVRELICQWRKDGGQAPCHTLDWCAPFDTFEQQLTWYAKQCASRQAAFDALCNRCEALAAQAGPLWEDSILLQVRIHAGCLSGIAHFAKAYRDFREKNYKESFFALGQAADAYTGVDLAMKQCGHDKWKGFYDNDCQSDIKETAYLLRQLMGYVRMWGDGPHFYGWQRDTIYAEKDRRILLLLNEENHLTDEELYRAMCGQRQLPVPPCAAPSALPFAGKTVLAFGDSIVDGHAYKGAACIEFLAQKEGLTLLENCANNGAHILPGDVVDPATGLGGVVLEQVKAAAKKGCRPDFVIFDGGINDAYIDLAEKLGNPVDAPADTLYGAFRSTIEAMQAAWPGAKIIYLAVHKTPARPLNIQEQLHAIACSVCRDTGVTVADLYRVKGMDLTADERRRDRYSFDHLDANGIPAANTAASGTHPNFLALEEYYLPTLSAALRRAENT